MKFIEDRLKSSYKHNLYYQNKENFKNQFESYLMSYLQKRGWYSQLNNAMVNEEVNMANITIDMEDLQRDVAEHCYGIKYTMEDLVEFMEYTFNESSNIQPFIILENDEKVAMSDLKTRKNVELSNQAELVVNLEALRKEAENEKY